jgi:hypothetical protein
MHCKIDPCRIIHPQVPDLEKAPHGLYPQGLCSNQRGMSRQFYLDTGENFKYLLTSRICTSKLYDYIVGPDLSGIYFGSTCAQFLSLFKGNEIFSHLANFHEDLKLPLSFSLSLSSKMFECYFSFICKSLNEAANSILCLAIQPSLVAPIIQSDIPVGAATLPQKVAGAKIYTLANEASPPRTLPPPANCCRTMRK